MQSLYEDHTLNVINLSNFLCFCLTSSQEPTHSKTFHSTGGATINMIVDKRKHVLCDYCGLFFAKLAQHLLQKHRSETEVQQILAMPAMKRITALGRLQNLVDFKEVVKVMVSESRERLQVRRIPRDPVRDRGEYLPCRYCYKFFPVKNLAQHIMYHCKESASSGGVKQCMMMPLKCKIKKHIAGAKRFLKDHIKKLNYGMPKYL